MIVDTSEVREFAAKLAAAPEKKRRRVAMIVKKGAQNVKNETRADLASSGNAAFRSIPISYDMHDRGAVVEADVAPDDGGAGDLVQLLHLHIQFVLVKGFHSNNNVTTILIMGQTQLGIIAGSAHEAIVHKFHAG